MALLLFFGGRGYCYSYSQRDTTIKIDVLDSNQVNSVFSPVLLRDILPDGFENTSKNTLSGSLSSLEPLFERMIMLRLAQERRAEMEQQGADAEELGNLPADTIRVLHIGDSHVRGHYYPRAAGSVLKYHFGAIAYYDFGIDGATCISYNTDENIARIASYSPDLIVISFGTNDCYHSYTASIHYASMEKLLSNIRSVLAEVPIILTTPPGCYYAKRGTKSVYSKKRKKNIYTRYTYYENNPRNGVAAATINRFGREHNIPVWDLFTICGGVNYASKNWWENGMMRPDRVHFTVEGYHLQGQLFATSIIQAFNDYVGK